MFCSDAFRYTRFSRRIIDLGGRVCNAFGGPVRDWLIEYYLNGEFMTAATDDCGHYFIRVREGDHVRIAPAAGFSSCEDPTHHVICCAQIDCFDLDFVLTPLPQNGGID